MHDDTYTMEGLLEYLDWIPKDKEREYLDSSIQCAYDPLSIYHNA